MNAPSAAPQAACPQCAGKGFRSFRSRPKKPCGACNGKGVRQPSHAFEHAVGASAQGLNAVVYRRGLEYSEGANAALKIEQDSRKAKAALLRIAAEVEEELEGLTNAPVCIDTDKGGYPYLWIEGDATEADTEVSLRVLTLAASKLGFFMVSR